MRSKQKRKKKHTQKKKKRRKKNVFEHKKRSTNRSKLKSKYLNKTDAIFFSCIKYTPRPTLVLLFNV